MTVIKVVAVALAGLVVIGVTLLLVVAVMFAALGKASDKGDTQGNLG